MECPRCKGQRGGPAFVMRRGSGCSLEQIDCTACGGTGEVSEDHAAMMAEGQRRMRDRIARDVSLRDEAKRLGVRPVDLSDMEHGRKPWNRTGTGP